MRSPDALVAQILRELLRAVRGVADEPGELRRVLIEALGGGVSGLHHMVDHVGAGGDLHVEKTLRLFARIGRERRSRLLRLTAGLARSLGGFRCGVAGFCAHILGWGVE
jgi:hypothetical protein